MCKLLSSFALYIINGLFLISSIVLIIIGALIQWGGDTIKTQITPNIVNLAAKDGVSSISINDLSKLLNQYVSVLGNSGLIIFIIGMLLFIISFCGSFGVFCKSNVLLYFYISFTFLIWLLMIIFTIYFMTQRDQMENNGSLQYANFLKEKYQFNNGSSTKSTDTGLDISGIVDILQARLQCCGSFNYLDFNGSQNYNTDHEIMPYSCCKLKPSSFIPENLNCTRYPSQDNSYMNDGCYPKLWSIIKYLTNFVSYALIGLAAILFILIISAGVLLHYNSKPIPNIV